MSNINNPLAFKHHLLFFFIVFAVVFFAYSPSLDAPFYLDDRDSIVMNDSIKSPTIDPLIDGPNRMRLIGYVSLWFNYQQGELNVQGYHWFNLAVHLINILLVFIVARQLWRYFYPDNQKQASIWALLVAALWAIHPLNSQTVIYVVQRLASITLIFYLLTIFSYIQLRRSDSHRLIWLALLLVSIGCGLHSKQNFVAVFVFLYCWELFTASDKVRMRLLAASAVGLFVLLLIAPFIPKFWQALDSFTRDPNAPDRVSYFYTQLVVLWDYIGRFFYPLPLQLEIEMTLYKTMTPLVGLAFFAHIALMGLAFVLRRSLPLFFIGILFFYTSHLVESSIIPIKDLAFEHRTYIGNVGLVLALLAVARHLLQRFQLGRLQFAMTGILGLVLLASSVVVYQRSTLWLDPLAFYANEVKHSPDHARANMSYGNELLIKKQPEQAVPYLKKGFEIDLAQHKISVSGLTTYMVALYQLEQYQKAAQVVMIGLQYIKWPKQRSRLLSNAAYGYIKMGYCDFAMNLLQEAMQLDVQNEDAKRNYRYCQIKQQQQAQGQN